jgi:predicted phage tail component-like protein
MLTYKGETSEGRFTVRKVTRSVLPPSQLKMVEVDGKAGAMFISKKHGVKQIDVEIAIIGDYVNKKRDIADWLDAEKPEALILSDEPDKTDFAILSDSTDMDEILDNGFGTLTFLCPDPYSIGAEKTHNLASGNRTVTYNGTAQVYPTLTVTFSTNQTAFEISNGEVKMRIEANLTTASTLVIDMNTGKITINGTLNQQTMTLDSDYFPLKKGTNALTISAGASVVVRYKERFK